MSNREPLPPIYRRFSAYLFSVVPILGIAVYFYGLRPLIMVSIAVIISIVSDFLVSIMRKRRYEGRDFSSIMFAVAFVLMLSASARYSIVIYGTIFTLFIKHAFGEYSGCIFQPAAFGFVASAICWPDEIFRYPQTFSNIGIGADSGALLYDGPAFTIKNGGIPTTIDRVDYLLGNHPGPMGATVCIILFAILLFLISCKVMTWHVPFIYLLTVAVYAFVFPRLAVPRIESVMYEVFSGVIAFSAVYIVADPVTSPVNPKAKLIYGLLLGVATMLFNHYGVFQLGSLFAVLLINPLSPYLDRKFPPKGARAR